MYFDTNTSSGKEILIIDKEVDFCILMQYYLNQREVQAHYCHNVQVGLSIVEAKRPAAIIIDTNIVNDRQALQDKINSMDNYTPTVISTSANRSPEDDQKDLLDKIGKYLKDIFRF